MHISVSVKLNVAKNYQPMQARPFGGVRGEGLPSLVVHSDISISLHYQLGQASSVYIALEVANQVEFVHYS